MNLNLIKVGVLVALLAIFVPVEAQNSLSLKSSLKGLQTVLDVKIKAMESICDKFTEHERFKLVLTKFKVQDGDGDKMTSAAAELDLIYIKMQDLRNRIDRLNKVLN